MLTLAEQQKRLLRILREDPGLLEAEADPWLRQVIHSPGLAMMREIASWWLRFQIESQCRYTSRLMKRMGCFESYLACYFRENPTPPAIEDLAREFLFSLELHPDPLIRAVAVFELDCLALEGAQPATLTTHWDRNPDEVLDALARFTRLPPPEPGVKYILTIEPDHKNPVSPRKICCTRHQVTRSS
jgi:hypothetical protein